MDERRIEHPAPRHEPPRLTKAQLHERLNSGRRDLSGVDLTGMKLDGLNLGGYNFEGSILDGAELNSCYFGPTRDAMTNKLLRSNFKGVSMQRARVYSCNFSETDLSEANLQGIHIYDSMLDEANLRESDLRGGDVQANIHRTDFSGAKLDGTTFGVMKHISEMQEPIGLPSGIDEKFKKDCHRAMHMYDDIRF